ncbi:acyltransferase domain-containing protein [Actinomycetota bacterium Odt1-20B]
MAEQGVLDVLAADETLAAWLRGLPDDPDLPQDVALPDGADLADVLLELAVPHGDIAELLALRRRFADDPGAWLLLRRCVGAVVRGMGEEAVPPRFLPQLPAELGAFGRCFYAYVLVAALPYTRAYHRGIGVPDEVARSTFADVGRNLALHRRRYGSVGVLVPSWLVLHLRGLLYQLGRLQFQHAVLGARTGAVVAAAGVAAEGDPCLNLHIPDYLGPLSPEACDQSLARAREFFARHYPQRRYPVAVCHSWLLDPQLRDQLPPESNIIRFQGRFRTARRETEPDDQGPVAFVFGDPELPVAELPRRTRLERAVGDHLRAGGHWYGGHGWFPL